ncbi:MAG: alginate O-acetyltransferase AlgX-related protein [Pirellulaceae bacterium]
MRPTRRAEKVLVVSFLAILAIPAIVQTIMELREGGSVQALDVFDQRPTAAHLRAYERELKDTSWLGKRLRPWVQYAQFTWLGDGGDKALVGHDGWLFYRPGVRYLTERAAVSPPGSATSPLAAIVDFRDQLATRGIRLVVMIAPNKESIYPERLSRRADEPHGTQVLIGPQSRQLMSDLAQAGVAVVDLWEVYGKFKQDPTNADSAPLYLQQDSHWSPQGVELAARSVARTILDHAWVTVGTVAYESRPAPVARTGDLVRMLQVPQIEWRTAPEDIACRRIVRCGTQQPYRDEPASEILVMGDSFLRIFAQDEPGSAGFLAHLAKELQQPLTSLVNDGGASTLVRQELIRRPTLLRNKRVVVWEFVERDIRFGTEGWQSVPLPPPDGPLDGPLDGPPPNKPPNNGI